ncbi:MAG: HD domain-containing protein, partial [Lachnospiraceae bacterium]|nr:HD domain-containing protein [Lachnospiraceae bacterium]
THAENGGDLLKNVNIVKNLAAGAGCHHERMDGKGYPKGLKGEDIPEVARIIAVADTFDAMYSTRPYRKQLELSVVLDEIKRIRGTQLEEDVVDALLELAGENKLDKAKVDAAIAETPEDAKA